MGVSASLELVHYGRRTSVKADLHTGTFSVVRATKQRYNYISDWKQWKEIAEASMQLLACLEKQLMFFIPPKLWRAVVPCEIYTELQERGPLTSQEVGAGVRRTVGPKQQPVEVVVLPLGEVTQVGVWVLFKRAACRWKKKGGGFGFTTPF